LACAAVLIALASTAASAKEPGARYCFHGLCYRVGTIAQTDTLVGWRGYVLASYYDDCRRDRLNPCGLTSSGAVFRPDQPDNAASPLLPDGTIILAYNPKTGDASVLRITNAGPYSGKRKLDVSRAAADGLGFRKQGVAALVISVLYSPTKAEASYVRRRAYPDVPGPLGRFETFDAALESALAKLDAEQENETLASNAYAAFAVGSGAGSEPGTGALGDHVPAIPKPRLAVSPSLARELVMLRTAPRPVSRVRLLVESPRLVRRGTLAGARVPAPGLARMDFAPGLRGVLEEDENGAE
jgi:rare lipoprotein A